MKTIVTSHDWMTATIRLEAAERHVITINANQQLLVGAPKLSYNDTTLSTDVTREAEQMVVTIEDLPGRAILEIPLKARTPITQAQTTLAVTVDDVPYPMQLALEGQPKFVDGRCRWIVNGPVVYGIEQRATLRLINDGAAPAQNLTVALPMTRTMAVAIDGTPALRDGRVWMLHRVEELQIGKRLDIPCTITWTDTHEMSAELTAQLEQNGQVLADVTLELERDNDSTPTIAMFCRQREVHIGQPIIVDVQIENDAIARSGVSYRIEGNEIAHRTIQLGDLQPLERRSFPITTELTKAHEDKWDVGIAATLACSDGSLATTLENIVGTGAAALVVTIDVAEADSTLAHAVNVRVENLGTGVARRSKLELILPEGVVTVTDTLVVDGRRRLALDGSVGTTIDLGALDIGQPREVTLAVRAQAAFTGIVAARASWGETSATARSAEVAFADGTVREVPAIVEPQITLAPPQQKPQGAQEEGQIEEPIVADPKPTEPTPEHQGAASGNQAGAAVEPTGSAPETPTIPDVELPEYLAEPSDAFDLLIPEEGDVVLGRAILALYDLLPTSIPNAEAELADLRLETRNIVERYLPSVRNNTFGASGYAFVTPRLTAALVRLRERLGEPEIDTNRDRNVILAILDLAGASGEWKDDIDHLRNRVMEVTRAIPSEEALGDPIELEATV